MNDRAIAELLLGRCNEEVAGRLRDAFAAAATELRPNNATVIVTLSRLIGAALPAEGPDRVNGMFAFIELILMSYSHNASPHDEMQQVLN